MKLELNRLPNETNEAFVKRFSTILDPLVASIDTVVTTEARRVVFSDEIGDNGSVRTITFIVECNA